MQIPLVGGNPITLLLLDVWLPRRAPDAARTPAILWLHGGGFVLNAERPHQGIGQMVPVARDRPANTNGRVARMTVLGALHHVYRRAA